MSSVAAEVLKYNLFGLQFSLDRVAFRLFGFEVYWYGIIIAVGFLLALIYAFRTADRYGLDKDRMMDVIIVGLVGAIVCARVYYLIFDGEPITSFYDVVGIHNGGLAIYGGIIGALLFGGIMCKIRKVRILPMFDLASLGFLIGQSLGRWGNFVNQEVFGKPTGSSWFGISGTNIGSDMVHPLFLYESLWCLCVFIGLHFLSKKRKFDGQIFCSYIMLYSFGRFWLEGMRRPDFILMLGRFSISQVVSLCAFVGAAVLYYFLRKRNAQKDEEYTGVFGTMYNDEDTLDKSYATLGCDWDSTDDEIDSAYESLTAKYTAMLSDKADTAEEESGDENANENVDANANESVDEERVKARLAKLEEAYTYIVNSRKEAYEESESSDFEPDDSDVEDGETPADGSDGGIDNVTEESAGETTDESANESAEESADSAADQEADTDETDNNNKDTNSES